MGRLVRPTPTRRRTPARSATTSAQRGAISGCSCSQRAPPRASTSDWRASRSRAASGPASPGPARRTTGSIMPARAADRSCPAPCVGRGDRLRTGAPRPARRGSATAAGRRPGWRRGSRTRRSAGSRRRSTARHPSLQRATSTAGSATPRCQHGPARLPTAPGGPARSSSDVASRSGAMRRSLTARVWRPMHRHVRPTIVAGRANVAPTTALQPPFDLGPDRIVDCVGGHGRSAEDRAGVVADRAAGGGGADEEEAVRAQLLVGPLGLQPVAGLAAIVGLVLVVFVVFVLGGDEAILEDPIEIGLDVVGRQQLLVLVLLLLAGAAAWCASSVPRRPRPPPPRPPRRRASPRRRPRRDRGRRPPRRRARRRPARPLPRPRRPRPRRSLRCRPARS